MNWRIVADSSCDLFSLEQETNIAFSTVPFTIRIGRKEYMDDAGISVDEMLTLNERTLEMMAQTACPSPESWLEVMGEEDNVLIFTISSNLSGSYNSACTARTMALEERPNRHIAVIDTKATGPETVLIIRKACQLIEAGKSFDEVEKELNNTAANTHIIFALSSYKNLIRAGRMSRLTGFVAGVLGFWGIGIGSDEGEIAMRGKVRGQKGMIRLMMEEIQRIGLAGKQIVISQCQNEEAAQELKRKLQELFRDAMITILPTRGLDSFYAERHGLIVGF